MSLAEAWSSFGPNAFASDPTASVQELAASILISSPAAPSPSSLALSKKSSSSQHTSLGVDGCMAANSGRASRKANSSRGLPAPPSHESSPREPSKDDDWTRVKDPKEKKRIQNRIAQRTYRNRMKARLGELQARLDSHEQRKLHASCPETSGQRGSVTRGCRASLDSKAGPSACVVSGQPTSYGVRGRPAPQIPMIHENIFHQPLATDPSLYGHDVGHLDGSSDARIPYAARPGTGRSITVSQDFILDCLRFQTQLLDRLNRLQSPDGGSEGLSTFDGSEDTATRDLSPSHHVNCDEALSPGQSDGLDFAFEAPLDGWKDEALNHRLRQPSPPADGVQFPSLAAMPTPLGSDIARPGSSSLDERLGGFMQHVEAAGFESFDDLVTAYYSDTFAETSLLSNEQRLSRNRRLPRVICHLHKAAGKWSSWERRGFHDEILKTAESMLVSETTSARGLLMSRIRPLIEAQDGIVSPDAGEVLHDMKKSIQQELPKSWALAMALAAQNRSSWQQDRSGTALAAILLLQFGGQIPHHQLLQLIGVCM